MVIQSSLPKTLKYLKKLILINFMSYEYAECNFTGGINTIVGPNENGKSNIIRAIKLLFFNETKRAEDVVRIGASECQVIGEMSDGFIVTRIVKILKSNVKNIYIVKKPDGTETSFENWNKDRHSVVPLEVIEATGVFKLAIDTDRKLAPNLSEQDDPPFLLKETGSVRAKAIGSIVKTNLLDAAEGDIQKDIGNISASVKEMKRQVGEKDEQLKEYENIAEEERVVGEITKSAEILKGLHCDLERVKEIAGRVILLKEEIAKTREVLAHKNVLLELEKETAKLELIHADIKTLSDLYYKIVSGRQVLSSQKKLKNQLRKVTSLEKEFAKLEIIHGQKKEISELISKMEAKRAELLLLQRRVRQLSVLGKIEKLAEQLAVAHQDKIQLILYRVKIEDCQGRIKTGNEYVKACRSSLKGRIAEYATLLKKQGKCPTCLHDISDTELKKIVKEMEGDCGVSN